MFKQATLLTILLLVSFISQADFNVPSKGAIKFPTGTEAPITLSFSVTQSDFGYTFTAGEQEMQVSDIPEKYSIWLSMNKDNLVYVQEFAPAYFTEFDWQLGEHSIVLEKKILSPKRSIGDYVLTIDNISYFFKGNQGSINILFDEDGISAIEANGFVKDLGVSE